MEEPTEKQNEVKPEEAAGDGGATQDPPVESGVGDSGGDGKTA